MAERAYIDPAGESPRQDIFAPKTAEDWQRELDEARADKLAGRVQDAFEALKKTREKYNL